MNDSRGLVLAIDQGTTGTKAMLVDSKLQIVGEADKEFRQHFPVPGQVEHEPEEIYESVRAAVTSALESAGKDASEIAAIGITNQRETTILWERDSGRPVHRAIVWQDRRTADVCEELKRSGLESTVRRTTGLLIDPYFSGTKIRWILDNVSGCRKQAEGGKVIFGTVDTYLTWRLTGGESHVTDVSNASRTLLMNLKSCGWDDEILKILQIPPAILPTIQDNDTVFGKTRGVDFLPDGLPITTILGDQQAALFGQACFDAGDAKCTYGTGAFLVLNTADQIVLSKRGLLSTAAWRSNAKTCYALEGSCFIAGAIVQWLRDGLGILQSSEEIEALAASVPDTDGVVLVPSLTGLGAPHWDPRARGLIAGITRGTTAAHIARAALEGIAFQIHDILRAMQHDMGQSITGLRVDGGAARNNLLLQFQADLLGVDVIRPKIISTTSLGAALRAGLTAGIYSSLDEIRKVWKEEARFRPQMKKKEQKERLLLWEKGIRQARL